VRYSTLAYPTPVLRQSFNYFNSALCFALLALPRDMLSRP